MKTPIVFKTTHRVQFSDLDLYNHVSTAVYARLYVDHRLQGLREKIGWGMKELAAAPFLLLVRRLEIDYLRPVQADQEITITSFVREFQGRDAFVECTMVDLAGTTVSRCSMTVAYVDKSTGRAADWPPDRIATFFEDATH